jgi:hypothetical protein
MDIIPARKTYKIHPELEVNIISLKTQSPLEVFLITTMLFPYLNSAVYQQVAEEKRWYALGYETQKPHFGYGAPLIHYLLGVPKHHNIDSIHNLNIVKTIETYDLASNIAGKHLLIRTKCAQEQTLMHSILSHLNSAVYQQLPLEQRCQNLGITEERMPYKMPTNRYTIGVPLDHYSI